MLEVGEYRSQRGQNPLWQKIVILGCHTLITIMRGKGTDGAPLTSGKGCNHTGSGGCNLLAKK